MNTPSKVKAVRAWARVWAVWSKHPKYLHGAYATKDDAETEIFNQLREDYIIVPCEMRPIKSKGRGK